MTRELLLSTANDVRVPPDIATQTLFICGKRGSGKSSSAVVIAEQLHAARVPFIVLDPKGDWWGMKAAADGKGPGSHAQRFTPELLPLVP